MSVAGVAHLVERHLAKVEVASSSLVARSIEQIRKYLLFFCAFSQARRMESDSPVNCQSPPFPAGIQEKDKGRTASYGRNTPETVSFAPPNS